MKQLILALTLVTLGVTTIAATAQAGGASVHLIRHFQTLAAVRPLDAPGFPEHSIMVANCRWLYRVEQPDGSAIETERCTLSKDPVPTPENQGKPPHHRVSYGGGKCIWISDFFAVKKHKDVLAASFRVLVTPRRELFIVSTYSAKPLNCG